MEEHDTTGENQKCRKVMDKLDSDFGLSEA